MIEGFPVTIRSGPVAVLPAHPLFQALTALLNDLACATLPTTFPEPSVTLNPLSPEEKLSGSEEPKSTLLLEESIGNHLVVVFPSSLSTSMYRFVVLVVTAFNVL